MTGKPGAAAATYSPSLTGQRKKRRPIPTDSEWVRPDGRGPHQCRPALFKTGAVNSASGSAYAEFGNTKVIVSVFGPRESKKAMMYSNDGRLNCNVSYTTFASPVRGQVKSFSFVRDGVLSFLVSSPYSIVLYVAETYMLAFQTPETKDLSTMLHKALEGSIMLKSFPKTCVDVFALVLESGGSDLPVITSCASLALADAGIMLYDMVASVSVSCIGENLLIDPVTEEESYQDGGLMITCMPSRNEVTQMTVTGEWSTTKINEAMQLSLDACSKLGKIMRSCLKEAASAPQD